MTVAEAIEYIALMYGRASVDQHKLGRSVKAQFRDNRDVCDENGWPVKAEFPDVDRSASPYATKERDKYLEMVGLIRSGEGLGPNQRYVIVVWEASRLSRNLDEFTPLRRLCQNTGTLICVDGETFDMRRHKDRQRLTRAVMDAEAEADNIQYRNARTSRLSVADGGVFGRIPYGYRREYDQDTGELLRQVEDEATAPYVVEIVERVAAGHGIDRIVRDFTARTVPDPRGTGWSRATVRWIARNPVYIGKRVHKGEIVGEGNWPPLIRDETKFWAAVAVLKDPARRTHRGNEPAYLLTGIPVCGRPVGDPPAEGEEPPRCGGRLYRSASRGGADRPKRQQYICTTCRKVSISMPMLDKYVQAGLLTWLEKPGRAEQVMKALGVDSVSETLAEIAQIEAQLAEARALAAQLRLTPAGLAASEAGLLPALAAARERLQRAVPNPALALLLDGDPRQRWKDMTFVTDRRSAIKAVMAIEVRSVGVGKRSLKWLPDRVRIRWILGS